MTKNFYGLPAEDRALILKRSILKEGWTLHERLRHAKVHSCMRDLNRNHIQMKLWSNAIAPDQPNNFNKRLNWDGLTLGNAAWALEPTEKSIPQEPEWWIWLNQLREAIIREDHQHGYKSINLIIGTISSDQPFVHVWHPIAIHLMTRLQAEYQQHCNNITIAITAWQGLAKSFLERICECEEKVLWEMFNSHRTTGSLLSAHLKANGYVSGIEENQDYDRFVNECINNGYEKILHEYPVLGRLIATISTQWFDMCKELISRIDGDFLELQSHYEIPNKSLLQNINLRLSDPHNNGRSVAVIEFSKNHDSYFLVYKPKDLRLDKEYHELLGHINSTTPRQHIRTLKIVVKKNYGYMEHVEHRACKSQAELNSFYFNAGRIMGILYLLGCTDCHYENLIASGNQLILIDTETLLEPNYSVTEDKEEQIGTTTAAQVLLQDSVLRSGLLPQWTLEGGGNKIAFDVSALGIEPPATKRFKQGWSAINSDLMMPALIAEEAVFPTSLPLQRGEHQRLYEFTDQLCEGFRSQLTEVIRNKQELLIQIQKLESLPRRFLARPTRLYYKLYRQMMEPASLRNAVDHGIRLELLSRCFILYENKPKTWVLFSDEVHQMSDFDIPFFEHRVNEKMFTPKSQSQRPVHNFFTGNGVESACNRVEKLEESTIVFQQKLIRGAIEARFATLSNINKSFEPVLGNGECGTNRSSCDEDPPEIYRLAKLICEEIWKSSLVDQNGRPEWLGMILGPDSERFRFGFIDCSLYSGSIGIAVAFARLAQLSEQFGKIDESSIWLTRASACIHGFLELSERNPSNLMFRLTRDRPYGTIGTSGMLLGLILLAEAGISEASILYNRIIDSIDINRIKEILNFDILIGVSSLIGPLIKNSEDKSKDIAMICGQRLLTTQLENGGWPQLSISRLSINKPLTGFGHGAAGIAASLLFLAKETGHQAYADGAMRGIDYERSTYDNEHKNWPDFRVSEFPAQFMMGWCHGAPGILISRLVMKKYYNNDDQLLSEINNARYSVLAKINKLDVATYPAHLCCGISSLISVLLIDSYENKQPIPQAVNSSIQALCVSLKQNKSLNFFRVNNQSINVPGLFTGKAGVALTLLEYASDRSTCLASLLSAGLL